MAAYDLYHTTNLGKIPYIRRLAPLETIEEGIGRSVEEAKSVHFRLFSLNPQQAGTLANLSIMGYLTEKVAVTGVTAFYTTASPAHGLEIMKGILRERYTKAGKLNDFNNPTSFYWELQPPVLYVFKMDWIESPKLNVRRFKGYLSKECLLTIND